MSTKINLMLKTFPDIKLEEKVPTIEKFLRVFCLIKFKKYNGWSKIFPAVVDTGAPISIIPSEIWKDLYTEILVSHEVFGLNRKRECKIPVKVGRIKCILLDNKGNKSKEIEFVSLLAETDKVPLILGFKNLLDKFRIYIDYSKNKTYIEEIE